MEITINVILVILGVANAVLGFLNFNIENYAMGIINYFVAGGCFAVALM